MALAIGLLAGYLSQHGGSQHGGSQDRGTQHQGSQHRAAPPASTSPSENSQPPAVGFSVPDLPFLDASQLDQQLAGIHQLGARWIRIELSWAQVQPDGADQYDWSRYDRVVEAAAKHQLKILGVIDYAAPWARDPACAEHFQCQPQDVATFARYAGAVASRYRDSAVSAVEIWNEPNIRQFWLPAPDPARYTALLQASYRQIKAVAPGLPVVTGGLSPSATVGQTSFSPLDFLQRSYDAGLHGSFDAIGYHPYSYPNLPSLFNAASAFSQIDRTPRSLRTIMAAHGDVNRPIWLTELGAPTGGPGPTSTCATRGFTPNRTVVTECLQAKLLADAICQASRTPSLGPTFIYTYRDRGTGQASVENFFGVLRADGSRKSSYTAVANAIQHPCH